MKKINDRFEARVLSFGKFVRFLMKYDLNFDVNSEVYVKDAQLLEIEIVGIGCIYVAYDIDTAAMLKGVESMKIKTDIEAIYTRGTSHLEGVYLGTTKEELIDDFECDLSMEYDEHFSDSEESKEEFIGRTIENFVFIDKKTGEEL